MENSTKALIMVGAVLLALMVTALLVYVFNQPGTMYSAINDKEETKKLQDFNKQYEAFNRNNLYGVDIISVLNKIIDNNAKEKNSDYKITMNVKITTPKNGLPVLDVGNYNLEELEEAIAESITESEQNKAVAEEYGQKSWYDAYRVFKVAGFKCTSIDYSPKTGRVQNMEFDFVRLGTN